MININKQPRTLNRVPFVFMSFPQLPPGPLECALRFCYHDIREANCLMFFEHPDVKLVDGRMDVENQHNVIIRHTPLYYKDDPDLAKWKKWVEKYSDVIKSSYTLQHLIENTQLRFDRRYHEMVGTPYFDKQKLGWVCDNLRYIAIHGLEKHQVEGKHLWDFDIYVQNSVKKT